MVACSKLRGCSINAILYFFIRIYMKRGNHINKNCNAWQLQLMYIVFQVVTSKKKELVYNAMKVCRYRFYFVDKFQSNFSFAKK